MIYDYGRGNDKNWIVATDVFNHDAGYQFKYEAIMCQGNGYMGIRASSEEEYEYEIRSTLVAGTFDQFGNASTELPRCADVTHIEIFVNGTRMDLRIGTLSDYLLTLNLKTGLLSRSFIWESPKGVKIKFESERFVSLKNLHLYATCVKVTALTDAKIVVRSGIDGDNNNRKGELHFKKTKILARDYLQYSERTIESGIDFVETAINEFASSEQYTKETETSKLAVEDVFSLNMKKNGFFCLEKYATIYTMRDKEYENGTFRKLKTVSRKATESAAHKGFDKIFAQSATAWKNKIWKNKDAKINSSRNFDQLAYRFAVYHLTVMSPVHDCRMNIGAKGLSGPGYRGHAFWDTEIYMLPMFIFTDYASARSLVASRFEGLIGAHKKAAENGYEGAMFPWESAWITDGETTPSWARTGLLEHHITADVAYGVHSYYSVSGDDDFMNKYGYELIFDTAKYWQSRVSYNKELDRYEICGVIGPDEFTEDVNNNAYTNYLAHLNMQLAIEYYDKLKKINPELLAALSEKLDLARVYPEWVKKAAKLYLPRENEDKIVPQDDTFLSLPDFDITPIKQGLGWPSFDVNKHRVSKQADVMVLFLLLEDLFSNDVKRENFYFYESRCTHSSSLSLSSYSVLAADIGEKDVAYNLYEKASRLDLGDKEMRSSDDGVHSASLGGIWQCTVFGFLGVRLYGDKLRIQPNLPKKWKSVSTKIVWRGQQLEIKADKKQLTVKRLNGTEPVSFLINGSTVTFDDAITIDY